MKCKKCGQELEKTDKFCPRCGEKIEIYYSQYRTEPEANTKISDKAKAVIQYIKEEIDEDESLTQTTDDEYRNGLVRQAKLLEIGYSIGVIICIKIAWDYRDFYGLKEGVFATFFSMIIATVVSLIIGADTYFGEIRIKKYDKLVKSSSRENAIKTMESRKGGKIRAVLTILLLTVGTIAIADTCCKYVAKDTIRRAINENSDSIFSPKKIPDLRENQQQTSSSYKETQQL